MIFVAGYCWLSSASSGCGMGFRIYCVLYECGHIEDQGNVTAAQYGRPCDALEMCKKFAHGLDHGLQFAHQGVDHQAGALSCVVQHHDALATRRRAVDLEQFPEPDERQHFAAQVEVAAGTLSLLLRRRQLHAFQHQVERHHVVALADADLKAVDDGEGQRQTDAHRGADALFTVEVHRASQGSDVAAHHVHADAAPRQIADLLGGGKAGLENEIEYLLVTEFLMRGDEAVVDGLLQDSVLVETAAVVGNFDDDAAGVVVGVEPQLSFYRLAVRAPHVGGFDAVIARVAHQVHERIADLFHHGFVEFGFRAGDDELDVFADFLADVAHHALEAAERLADLYHAQLQRAVADFLHQARERRGGILQHAVAGTLREQMGGGPGDDELAHVFNVGVELIGLNANQAAFLGLLLTTLFLFFYRRIHHRLVDYALADQNMAERLRCQIGGLLRGQALVELTLSEGAAFHQKSAELVAAARQFVDKADELRYPAVGRQDAKFAIIAHEFDHILDFVFAGRRFDVDLETDITALRIHGVDVGQLIEYGGDRNEGTELAEIAQKEGGVHAVAQHVSTETQRKMPSGGGYREVIGGGRDGRVGSGIHMRGRGRLGTATGVRGLVRVGTQFFQQQLTGGERRRRRLTVVGDALADQRTDVVAARQQHGGEIGRDAQGAAAHFIHYVFDDVGEGDHGVEREQAG